MEKVVSIIEVATAKIKTGKNEGKTYWKPKVELAEGGQPFTVNIFEPKLGETLEPGKTYRLDMEKDDKGYWQIKAILGETAKPISAPEEVVTPDARGASIERQVALKAAVEMAGYYIARDIPSDVLLLASEFAEWLRGVPKTATEKPVGAKATTGASEDYDDEEPGLTIAELRAGCEDLFAKLGLVGEKKKAWVAKNVPGIVGIPPDKLAREQWQALYDRLRLEWEQK